MAKDGAKECTDCANPDIEHISIFGGKGDGRCSECRGEGTICDIGDVISGLAGFDNFHECEKCSGTGQCQTCGGTGFEYYYEDFEDDEVSTFEDTDLTSNENSNFSSRTYDTRDYISNSTLNQKSSNIESPTIEKAETSSFIKIIKTIWIAYFVCWLSFNIVPFIAEYANSDWDHSFLDWIGHILAPLTVILLYIPFLIYEYINFPLEYDFIAIIGGIILVFNLFPKQDV